MAENLQEQFILKLEEKYGKWERETSKFGVTSFGKIADDLCISKSQFTMLISDKATEGMYIRSIRNVAQLIKYDEQNKTLEAYKTKGAGASIVRYLVVAGIALLAGWLLSRVAQFDEVPAQSADLGLRDHPLGLYFDGDFKADYVSPFLRETEVQSYCPCSAYEGVWKLAEDYIIPLPGKKPGLYYVAKSTDVRIKCHKGVDTDQRGKVMIGFEHMQNELWLDRERRPLSPQYFDLETKSYTDAFYELDLEEDPDFVKVADVYSCFFDYFIIEEDSIYRRGEPCGRHARNINESIVDEFEIDVKHILEDIISSMAQIQCAPAENLYCDPNDLEENQSVLTYDCLFKIRTENLGIGGGYPYSKSYQLLKQNYSDNLLCGCD